MMQGMNTTQGLDMIKSSSKAVLVSWWCSVPSLVDWWTVQFEDYAIWLGGLTQKDSITSMLRMGVRFFDFRPGHLPVAVGSAGWAIQGDPSSAHRTAWRSLVGQPQ